MTAGVGFLPSDTGYQGSTLTSIGPNLIGTTGVLLGMNSPSSWPYNPYTWAEVKAEDGTICVIPMWRL